MKKTVLIKNIKNKKGFSLLELLLVLGIIAALVVAAFIVYPKVQASQRAQAESNNIATIQAGVKALYTSASSFTGLTNTVAVQAKIFPDNMYCIHTRFYSSPMEFGWKSRNQLVDNQLSME